MPLVQGTHRRHQADALALPRRDRALPLHVVRRRDDPQADSTGCAGCQRCQQFADRFAAEHGCRQSAAISAAGARTNRRSSIRGCGTIEFRRVDKLFAVKQQIEVDRPRPPAFAALAAQAFVRSAAAADSKLARRQSRFDERRGIEKLGLAGRTADRARFEERADVARRAIAGRLAEFSQAPRADCRPDRQDSNPEPTRQIAICAIIDGADSSPMRLRCSEPRRAEKLGGRPFLDQVADCRSARSSAPRCMRTSAARRFQFISKKSSTDELQRDRRGAAAAHWPDSERSRFARQNERRDSTRAASRDALRANELPRTSDHNSDQSLTRCRSPLEPLLVIAPSVLAIRSFSRLGVLCEVAASCQHGPPAIFLRVQHSLTIQQAAIRQRWHKSLHPHRFVSAAAALRVHSHEIRARRHVHCSATLQPAASDPRLA